MAVDVRAETMDAAVEPTVEVDLSDTLQTADPLIGTVVDDRYRIESILGDGGMGLVYSARHVHLGRSLAIKVLKPELLEKGQFLERFEREAYAATRLSHHNVINTVDYGTLPDGTPYIAMEKLGGVTLDRVIETDAPMDPRRVMNIVRQVCEALTAAHEQGVVHRDLKPENIQLVEVAPPNDIAKVFDFGIAKVSGVTRLTMTGHILGTPYYMAPEQCRGAAVDGRTDIYSVGVMLYELLTGRLPFEGSLAGVLSAHLTSAPVPPSVYAALPEGLDAVVLRCMEKDPAHRFASAADVAMALERIERGLPVETVPRTEPAPKPRSAPRSNALRWTVIASAIGAAAAVWLAMGLIDHGSHAIAEPAAAAPPMPVPAASAPAPAEERLLEEVATAEMHVTSTPPGAVVHWGDTLIGNTPLSFPPPDEAVELHVTLDGYVDETVVLEPDEERLDMTLTRERRAARARRRAPRTVTTATPSAPPPTVAPPTRPTAPPEPSYVEELGLEAPPGW